MGKYDSQLKNYYEKQTSGKADLGLYQKQNKDGSVSASKEVQDRAAANRHIYAEIAPTLANSTNKAGYASWMKPNNDVYFGSQTFDGDAFNAARSDFMDNFMLNTKTANKNANHPKYGYDWNDPEDVQRYEQGKISKKYEGTYTDDPFDQFLKAYGQASSEYFAKTYYPKAYSKVIADRAAQQRIKDFRKAVANETWSTASDPMNITGDDIAAAAQRIQLSNPIYKDIELYNPKDSDSSYDSYLSPALAEQTAQAKEQKNRTGKLSLDDVMSDIARYQNRVNAKVEQAQEQQQEETVKTQNIINTAIADSGFSVEIDKRVGLARDSKLKEYNSNKQKKQTASDIAIAAMREAGYSNQDIQKAIRQDGRLSYSESTEGKANEAERIARRDSSDATSAKILNGMDSFTQGAVDKAKKLGNMGTSSQKGFSPISMMEGYGLSAQETQAVNNYVDTTRAILETQGYNGLEIDNALRRADLGEYIPTATARTNYATYTLQECGLTDEQIQQVLATYTEEDWKNVDKDMLASDYVENSMADQLANSIISMPIRAALSIACGAVGLVDMGAAAISGRKELWKFTDDLQELSAWVTQFSHDRNHEIISTAADVGAEIMRMRATALIGSALTPAATTTSGSAAGTNFLFNFMQKNASHLPFISGAIGNYYLEAVNGGATPRMAALYAIPAGALEGYLESLEMGEVLQHSFGMNIVGKKIAASGLSANFKQFAITKGMPFINFALGTIGEGLEEAASYYGSSIARMATWDKGYEMDFSEMWDNAKGGLLIGGIMNGLSMGAHTQSYKYASEIYKGTGGNYAAYLDSFMSAMHMENMNDVQRQALIDKYNSGEINVSRDAAINAGVEIQTNAEVVAAKKQAVESAENDAAVKVENANNKVTQAEQRLAGIDDPDPVKKGKKLTQAARELTAAKAAASQTASEGQKKVDTATADYKSEAAKAKRKNAANQQLVDEYHASKYCSDIEAETDIAVEAAVTAEDIASLESLLQSEKEKLAAMPYQNSKAAIRRKDRIAKLENQIASAKSSLNAAVSPAAVDPAANTNVDANTAQNGIDSIKNGVAEQDAQEVQSAEPALKDLGANTPTPAVQEAPQRAEQPVFRESRTATNTLSKVVGEDVLQQLREYEPNLLEHEVVSNSRSMELAAQKIEEKGIDGTEYELLDDNRVWENGDADASMSIITKRIEDGDMMSAAILAQNLAERETKAGQQIQELAKWTKTSAGMVTEAARNTQKALENAKPIVKDAVKSDTKAVKKANKKAQKEAADAAGKKLASDTAKSVDPAELLARKIVNATKPRTVEEADFVKRVVQDLFGVAKESPIVTPGEATDNTYSRVGKAYSDIGKYSDIWERAQEVVLQTMGDTPEVRQALAGYFTKENRPIVPESLLKKAYKKATDELGIDMSKLIRKTAGNVDAMRNELVNYLVSTTGVSEDGAVALAMEANRMFNNAEAQARAKYLRGVFRTKSFNEAATNALTDIESMVNAGALIDIEFADQIEAKLNEKLRKAIKESGYSIGDIVARGANGELEALAHFVTDVSGIDVNRADMETVLNAAIDTFGNVLDEFKTTQLDKLYEKLTAKQNNSTAADKRKPTEAEKAINNWILGLYNDSRFTDEIKAANGIPILTEADIQQIADYMQVYNTSTDERAAKEAAYRAGQIVASKQGDGSVKDKVRALSYMNMLLNFKTGIKNFSANLPMYVTETLKDVPGTLLDKVVSKYFGTGRTTNAFTTERFSGQLNSFGKGMKDAVLDMVHDVNTSPIPGRVEDVRANTFKSEAMNRLERRIGQYMQLGDRAWAQMAYDGRLGELKSLGYDITTEAAAKDAELYMLDRVFQNNSVLAQKAVSARNAFGVFGDLILPFAQTPANIADKLLDYSPVGLARAIKQLGTETDIRTHTASSEFNQKLFVDRVSRSLTGTGILALGMAMAAKGLLTREPEDEATRSLTRQAGANAYAIKIGDTYHTINWSEPAGSLLIIGATLQSMFSADSAKDVLSIAYDAASGGVNAFFNNSFLSSFADLLSSDTPADAIFDSLLSGSSRIVASQVGAVARATDKYERDTYDPNVLKRQVNYIISRVPGLRQTLPIKVGTDGQYQLASAGSSLGERILNTMFIPGYATRETDDPVNQELYRLYNEGYDEQVLPSANYKINGHKLTGEERREYQTIIGKISHSLAAQVINTKEYQQATDAEKAAMLEDGISEVWQHPDVKAFKKRFKK